MTRRKACRRIEAHRERVGCLAALEEGETIALASVQMDRRLNRRYPVAVRLEYEVTLDNGSVATGLAQTTDISSSGVLFQTADALPVGLPIQLSIHWPARLHGAVALSLHVTGRTMRREGDYTAVVMSKHEFRTRASQNDHKQIDCLPRQAGTAAVAPPE